MRKFALLVIVLAAALLCFAEPASTNTATVVSAVVATTNAPANLPSEANFAKQSDYSSAKLPRQQCEAVTKSGNRCKRNAAPGAKLCRQHQKILNSTLSGK